MGWWKIDDVKTGRIDWKNALQKYIPFAANARPTDDPNELYNGDGPADVMGEAIRKIANLYMEFWGRAPKMLELQACLNFCANPFIIHGEFVPWRKDAERSTKEGADKGSDNNSGPGV